MSDYYDHPPYIDVDENGVAYYNYSQDEILQRLKAARERKKARQKQWESKTESTPGGPATPFP